MKSNKTFLLIFISSSLFATDNNIINSIGLNIGASNSSYVKKDKSGSITLSSTPKKSFNSYELYITLNPISKVCKSYNLKPYLSYTYSDNKRLKHQYLLAGLNKYFDYKTTSFYTGVLLGYGEINWKYDPLNSSKSINNNANSFISGVQLGLKYPINKRLSLGVNTKYLLHDYKTKLKPTLSEESLITHKSTSSFMLGVEYSF